MLFRRFVFALAVGSLVLPIFLAVLLGTARLLSAMGDATGARVVDWIGLGVGVCWGVDLVCLVVVQAIQSLAREQEVEELPPP